MALPNHDAKYDSDPVVTPEKHADYWDIDLDGPQRSPPDAVVLCYSSTLMEYLVETNPGTAVEYHFGRLYLLADADYRVGILGDFGIGAPTTAMLVDDLVADGVEAFLSIGFAGCLDDAVEMGEFIVCEKAIRDEGTSHHYVESETWAHPDDALVAATTDLLDERGEPYHVGPSWTIDAIYQETEAEIERYAEAGVLTVEMEAAAVFAVAAHRGVDAGAMFVVSDYLGPGEWDPKFHLAREDMQRLGEAATAVLRSHIE